MGQRRRLMQLVVTLHLAVWAHLQCHGMQAPPKRRLA
jgi:hypothetical protein